MIKAAEMALALQVRAEMAGARIDQKGMAEAIGVGRSALNMYLQGRRSLPMPTFFKIADVLGLAPSVILARAAEREAAVVVDALD